MKPMDSQLLQNDMGASLVEELLPTKGLLKPNSGPAIGSWVPKAQGGKQRFACLDSISRDYTKPQSRP